jgi:small-conductance mechanosensitive channel
MSKDKMEKLHAAYNSEMAHGADDEEKDAKTEERLKSVNVKEHVDALLGADTNLSEEFKVKAATIFETAVKSKIREEIKRLEEEYKSELIEEVADVRTSLTEKVDNYLNYVVEEWMKENELALERGLKGEIAEDFISGLKTLFEDHYIDVPDDKYDVLEAQAEKISKLEEKLEATIQQVVESKKAEGFLVQEKVLKDVSSDLTSTEIEKFESLVQDVEFTEETVYAEKLNTLKESYFPKQVISEATDNDVETGTPVQDITEDSSMAAYMSAIGRTVNSAN